MLDVRRREYCVLRNAREINDELGIRDPQFRLRREGGLWWFMNDTAASQGPLFDRVDEHKGPWGPLGHGREKWDRLDELRTQRGVLPPSYEGSSQEEEADAGGAAGGTAAERTGEGEEEEDQEGEQWGEEGEGAGYELREQGEQEDFGDWWRSVAPSWYAKCEEAEQWEKDRDQREKDEEELSRREAIVTVEEELERQFERRVEILRAAQVEALDNAAKSVRRQMNEER